MTLPPRKELLSGLVVLLLPAPPKIVALELIQVFAICFIFASSPVATSA